MSNETAPNNKPKKSSCFTMMLYPDCIPHCTFVDTILNDLGLVWYGILHDKDLWEKDVLNEDGTVKYAFGELKKPHWHIIIFTPYPMTLNAFRESMKFYEIEEHLSDTCNKYFYTRYLTHIAYRHTSRVNTDKHFYDETLVFGNRDAFFKNYRPIESEEAQETIWEVFEKISRDDEKYFTIVSCMNLLHHLGLRQTVTKNSAYMRILQQIIIEKRGNKK